MSQWKESRIYIRRKKNIAVRYFFITIKSLYNIDLMHIFFTRVHPSQNYIYIYRCLEKRYAPIISYREKLTCVARRIRIIGVDIYGSWYFEIESVYVANVYICMHINAGPREMFSIPREGSSPAFNLRLAICSPVATPVQHKCAMHSGCIYMHRSEAS